MNENIAVKVENLIKLHSYTHVNATETNIIISYKIWLIFLLEQIIFINSVENL